MDDFGLYRHHSVLMLKVLVLLTKQSGNSTLRRTDDYTRMLFLNLSLMRSHRHRQTLLWKMLKGNIGAFNEESGETSFSVLSRCTLGDTTKTKFEHLDKMYRLLGVHRQMNMDVEVDIPIANFHNGRYTFKENNPSVPAVNAFIHSRMRQIRNNVFSYYSGSRKSFQNHTTTARVDYLITTAFPVIYKDSIAAELDSLSSWLRENMLVHFIEPFVEFWPSAVRELSDHSSDISLDEPIEVPENAADEDSDARTEVERDVNDPISPVVWQKATTKFQTSVASAR
jgi:hypothetical protein